MTRHKFSTGDRVELTLGASSNMVPAGVYTIVWPMPVTSQGCQYRVKSVAEGHERVLDEAQLRAI